MIAQALLELLPQLLGHDRRMLAFMDLALMSDPADIDWVRQELVDMSPTEQSAAGRAARAIDPDRDPKALGVEPLLEANDGSRFEGSGETGTERSRHDPRRRAGRAPRPGSRGERRPPSRCPSSSRRRSCPGS